MADTETKFMELIIDSGTNILYNAMLKKTPSTLEFIGADALYIFLIQDQLENILGGATDDLARQLIGQLLLQPLAVSGVQLLIDTIVTDRKKESNKEKKEYGFKNIFLSNLAIFSISGAIQYIAYPKPNISKN